jgi:glycosyltransferase involved in cell wall biosynthesis
MISIIIPALNEEKYLPLLLQSIKKQVFFAQDTDYEIILADAGSADKTLEIAREYGCKIILGGLPAKGRNEGAKIAGGEILFFCDADVVLLDNFLQKALAEFKARSLDLATVRLIPIPESKVSYFLVNTFYNNLIILLENILPYAAVGIFVKKEIFDKTGGFDEEVKLSEDHYFARQAKKIVKAKCGILRSTEVFVSDRRFKTDGWVSVGTRYFLCELHNIFIGPVKTDIFKYKFNHYKK